LHIDDVYGEVPEGSRLVSCCPALQAVTMCEPCSAKLLAQLQGLSGLRTLHLRDIYSGCAPEEGVQRICQLTMLRELRVRLVRDTDVVHLLQLTQLRQLTTLRYFQYYHREPVSLSSQVSKPLRHA
jgi:hypothetical protein